MLEKLVGDEMIRARKSNWPSDRLNDLATLMGTLEAADVATRRRTLRPKREVARDRFLWHGKSTRAGTPIRPPESQRPPSMGGRGGPPKGGPAPSPSTKLNHTPAR